MVKIYRNKACVVHGHPKKAGSKTDKPKGSVIHCYYFGIDGTKQECIQKAHAMHSAIMHKQKRR